MRFHVNRHETALQLAGCYYNCHGKPLKNQIVTNGKWKSYCPFCNPVAVMGIFFPMQRPCFPLKGIKDIWKHILAVTEVWATTEMRQRGGMIILGLISSHVQTQHPQTGIIIPVL